MDNNKNIAFFQSIKTQMILPVLLFSIFVCLILIFVIAPRQHQQLIEVMEENSKSLVNAVSFGVGVGLEFEDQSSVEEALEGVKSLENLSYIMVFDGDNKIFYEHNKENAQDINYTNVGTETESFVEKNLLNVSSPIKGRIGDSNELVGKLLLGLKMDDLMLLKQKNQVRGLWVSLAIFLVGLIFAIVGSSNISNPISKIIQMIQEINKGNLSYRLQMKRRDEIGIMASAMDDFATSLEGEILAAFKSLADGDFTFEADGLITEPLKQTNLNLNQLMSQLNASADQMKSGAGQVNNASQSLSQGATEQAAALEEISSSLGELGEQTKTNAENANQANQLSDQAMLAAEKGNRQMQEMVSAMDEINDSSHNISKIIKVIDEIAFQTNLLALNAAVEAARAGKYGRGFAVVAEEVRNLAARSAKAAKETSQLIEGSVGKAARGSDIANLTAEALGEIVKDVSETTQLIGDIAEASNQQAQGITQVNRGLTQVDQVTQQNTANAEESAAAAEELSSQANELRAMLGQFKLMEAYRKQTQVIKKNTPWVERTDYMSRDQEQLANDEQEPCYPQEIIKLDDQEFGKYYKYNTEDT
jgi:methyl-accepting chemotaxis protein